MEKLVADARSRFDLVIIDTPPVLAVADVLGLVPMVDDVLLVVSVDQTTEADVAAARAELAHAGARVIGAAINRSAETTARYDAYHREPGPF
jgi:tyrosine-protein kinase Etk/Wzc